METFTMIVFGSSIMATCIYTTIIFAKILRLEDFLKNNKLGDKK